MRPPPFLVTMELTGWILFWADLELVGSNDGPVADLRRQTAERARERFDAKTLKMEPTVAAMRRLFRAAGCDPTRYRPSSEALLRRLVRGSDLPAIHPLVDFNNCLSAELAVPCCVMAEGTFDPPLVFRSGRAGEAYGSLRGPFNLERKPLLCDSQGPLDCPITGGERVKVTPETTHAWLVAYLPSETVEAASADDVLQRLSAAVPQIRVIETAATTESEAP